MVTITTSAAHNIPSARYSNGFLYPQIEIASFSSNSRYCEGAFTLVGVPSGTQVQITRYGVPDTTMNGCSGGTLRVLPRVILSWDSHYSYAVTNAACTGSTATLTISPGIYGPNNSWMVPYGVKAVIAGVSDSHYNIGDGADRGKQRIPEHDDQQHQRHNVHAGASGDDWGDRRESVSRQHAEPVGSVRSNAGIGRNAEWRARDHSDVNVVERPGLFAISDHGEFRHVWKCVHRFGEDSPRPKRLSISDRRCGCRERC